MNAKKPVIGYAPTRRNVFSKEDARIHKIKTLEKIKSFGVCDIVDLEGINDEGLLFDEKDLCAVIKRFKEADVDGVFFPHCNFGTEFMVGQLAKALDKPALIWAPRDDAPLPGGERSRDSQCGLFATGKVMRRFNMPFSYIVNDTVDCPVFEKGFRNFAAVTAVVKAFRNIRILQIAPRPAAFWTMICNEGELLEKFGIQVFPITMQDVVGGVNKLVAEKGKAFTESLEALKNKMHCGDIPDADVAKLAAIKLLMKTYCEENNCTAIAIQCWDALQDGLGINPCLANGLLTEENIPTTCETDIHGAVSAIMLQAASLHTTPIFFADLTVRHPTNHNAELLWHCGNFPPSLAKEGSKMEIGRHFINPSHCPGTGEWELKGGPITICRFDGDHGEYQLMIGEGQGVDGPKTRGTYVWFEVKNWPRFEEKLVQGPYVHHCAGIHGHFAAVLYEACRFIPGLNADAIEPTACEIESWLRL